MFKQILAAYDQTLQLQRMRERTIETWGIDGIKIPLQVVELASYRSFYLATAWLFLFGNS